MVSIGHRVPWFVTRAAATYILLHLPNYAKTFSQYPASISEASATKLEYHAVLQGFRSSERSMCKKS